MYIGTDVEQCMYGAYLFISGDDPDSGQHLPFGEFISHASLFHIRPFLVPFQKDVTISLSLSLSLDHNRPY